MFELWNFALTQIIKHDHKIHDTDHKFLLAEILDNIKMFERQNAKQQQIQ
jgi:hypothetical protein